MYRDVLVPTDGSQSMETVLEHTIEVAAGRDATVHVLYVINNQAFLTLDDEMKDDVLADLREEGENALRDAKDTLEDATLDVTTEITKGKPSEEIISYVEREGIDIVTMGTRGDDYTENILGSTSQKVVTKSPVPVLSVNVAG